jgi:hypothetical protein
MANSPLITTPGVSVGNVSLPPEGPKALPFKCDFTAQQAYQVSSNYLYQQKLISNIQSLYVDNSASATPLYISVDNTQQSIAIPPGAQAYLPLLIANNAVITFYSTGGVVIPFELLNIPVPSAVWYPNQGPQKNLYDINGNLKTADQLLAPYISANGLLVNSAGSVTHQLTYNWVGVGDGPTFTPTAGKSFYITGVEISMSGDAAAAAASNAIVGMFVGGSSRFFCRASIHINAAGTTPDGVFPISNLTGVDFTSDTAGDSMYFHSTVNLTAGNFTALITYYQA